MSFKDIMKEYSAKMPNCRAESERASQILPMGSPGGLGMFVMPHEITVDHGKGAYLWDVDGNKYLDFFCGDWTAALGYCNEGIMAAVSEQLAKGTTFGLPAGGLGPELAGLLQQRMPSLDMVRFTCSGTEANQNAMRLARGYTGRKKVAKLSGGYHGSTDELTIQNALNKPDDDVPGMPIGAKESLVLLPPNDIAACEKIIEQEKDNLAAILFESVMGVAGFIPCTQEFVDFIREITDKHGIVLIFDEVVTTPLGTGGAQGYYGVRPDLTTFGKVMGGGLPLAGYGGRKDIMGMLDFRINEPDKPFMMIASTYGGMPVCLAAGIAALKQLTPEVHEHLDMLGQYMRDGINQLAQKHNIPLQATGLSQFIGIHWTPTKVVDYPSFLTSDRAVINNIMYGLAVRGCLGTPMGQFLCTSPMTRADIDFFLDALEQSLRDNELIA